MIEIRWNCPHCECPNADYRELTARPICEECFADFSWSDVESTLRPTMTLEQILEKEYPKGKRWGMKAFVLGWEAAKVGTPREKCPYIDYFNNMGVTFSRGYRRAWFKGYDRFLKESWSAQ